MRDRLRCKVIHCARRSVGYGANGAPNPPYIYSESLWQDLKVDA